MHSGGASLAVLGTPILRSTTPNNEVHDSESVDALVRAGAVLNPYHTRSVHMNC